MKFFGVQLKIPWELRQRLAKTIIESGADYVLALKENQKTLHVDVELYFKEEVLKKGKKELVKEDIYHITLEKNHGRIEKREYYMVNDVSWLEQLNSKPISENS